MSDDIEQPAGPVTPLNAALRYIRHSWSPIPVPFQSKEPVIKGWPQLRITAENASQYFNGKPMNIGILVGEPSGWLVDIDLDHPLAVKYAPQHLPHSATFGRASKLKSHWVYFVTDPIPTKKYRSKSAGMLVEVRSTGQQTIFPPSVHVSGEAIEWTEMPFQPVKIESRLLLLAVEHLANAVREELGEKPITSRKGKPARRGKQASVPSSAEVGLKPTESSPAEPLESEGARIAPPSVANDERARRCLTAMMKIGQTDKNDGSARLYTCACRIVEHDLTDDAALDVMRSYVRERPFPADWSDDDILQRIRDAENRCTRGAAFVPERDDEGLICLGARDPETGRVVLSSKRTLPTAQAYAQEFHQHEEGRTLHSYAGQLLAWRHNRYADVEDEAMRQRLQRWLHEALRYVFDRESGEMVLVPFESNPGTVKAALESIRAYTHLPVATPIPSWLDDSSARLPSQEILACRTILVHLPTMTKLLATPAFFATNALEFDPDPTAPVPMVWLRFLQQLFDDDIQALELLQEWFGYVLIADTSQQKMLLMVGPKRSGKGTIARILARLIGTGNVCGPTTSSLAGPFGLQPLIGKTLAIVSDARFAGDSIATVVERLLCISGEDNLTIDRKHIGSVTMKLPTRFMFLTNELPRLNDSSGALAGRFLILRLTQSFYGHEDHGLTDKLLAELPGILNWAIEGWQRLRERGHFVQPQSAAGAVQEIEDLSSPVGAFVREWCTVGVGHRINVDDLYAAWSRWCELEGRHAVTTRQMFGRDLVAAVPGIARRRSPQPFYEGIAIQRATS